MKKLNLAAASAAENEDNQWKRIFLAGAGCALAAVLTGLFDIAVTFLPGGGFSAALTMYEWFTLLHTNPLVGLRNLDLPNLIVIPFGLVFSILSAIAFDIRTNMLTSQASANIEKL